MPAKHLIKSHYDEDLMTAYGSLFLDAGTGSQTLATHGTYYIINQFTKVGNVFDMSVNLGSSTISVNETGAYSIQVDLSGMFAGSSHLIAVFINGVRNDNLTIEYTPSSTAFITYTGLKGVVSLTSGDIIDVRISNLTKDNVKLSLVQGNFGVFSIEGSGGVSGIGPTGAPGPTGAQGPQGLQGNPGVAGVTGAQGPQGSPGTTGPQGSPGVTGAQGVQGSPGVTGATGVQGPQGSPGVTGIDGATGPQGVQGSPGVTGATGVQGIQGVQGSPGVTGATGSQGVQGSPGVTGATGPQGAQGSPGVTGVQGVQGSPGITGATGIQGVQGSPGVTGATGPQGAQGSPGITGATGATGPQGNQGNQGSPGVTGATGPQGNQGSPGITGATGATGVPGINAYSESNGFTQPQIGTTIALQVPSAYWLQVGQYVFIPSGGYYTVASGSVPTFSFQNLGYSGVNIPVGSTVGTAFVSPGGAAGSTGVTGATGPQGAQGSQGSPGVTGVTGPTGAQGSQGSPGVTGVTGPAGINAYSTTAGFTQPAVGAAIAIQVPSSYWMQVGQYVFIGSGGYYVVASGAVPTFSIQNLGYSGVNIPVGSTVAAGFISPGGVGGVTGVQGATGAAGSSSGFSGATAGGNLTGTYPNPTVAKIQGNSVDATVLGTSQDGYVMTWVASGSNWIAKDPNQQILMSGKRIQYWSGAVAGQAANGGYLLGGLNVFFAKSGAATIEQTSGGIQGTVISINTLLGSTPRLRLTNTAGGNVAIADINGQSPSGTLGVIRGAAAGIGGFVCAIRWGIDKITASPTFQFFAGLNDGYNGTMPIAQDWTTHATNTKDSVGFAFTLTASSNVFSGNYTFVTSNSSACTSTDTGMAVTIGDLMEGIFSCQPNGSNFSWIINNLSTGTTQSGVATQSLPLNTALMMFQTGYNISAGSASTNYFSFVRYFLESNQ